MRVDEHAKTPHIWLVRAINEADFTMNKQEKLYFGETSRKKKVCGVTKEGRNEGLKKNQVLIL